MSKLTLKASPDYCPGSYDLHLYCKYENPRHGWDEFPHHYSGEYQTYGEAAAAARSAGWILHRDGLATCPKCASDLRELRSRLMGSSRAAASIDRERRDE